MEKVTNNTGAMLGILILDKDGKGLTLPVPARSTVEVPREHEVDTDNEVMSFWLEKGAITIGESGEEAGDAENGDAESTAPRRTTGRRARR
jgi:hypothetical protein